MYDGARLSEKVMLCNDQLLWRRAAVPAGRQRTCMGTLCKSEHLQDTPCGCWEAAYLSACRRTGHMRAALAWSAFVAATPQRALQELPLAGCSAPAAACPLVQMAVSIWTSCVQPADAFCLPDSLLFLQHMTGLWMAVSQQLDCPQRAHTARRSQTQNSAAFGGLAGPHQPQCPARQRQLHPL